MSERSQFADGGADEKIERKVVLYASPGAEYRLQDADDHAKFASHRISMTRLDRSTMLTPSTTRADSRNQIQNLRSPTRTALRGMCFALTSALLCFATEHAAACSFSFQMSAKMPTDSAELTNADRIRLANLVIDVRALPVPGSAAVVYSYASESEHSPRVLAARRSQTVTGFLSQMGIELAHIYVESTVVPRGKNDRNDVDQVDIQFTPLCPPGGCGFLCGTPINK